MSTTPLTFCLDLHRAEARLRLRLDDVLGTLHGIGWEDFALLATLVEHGGRLPLRELADHLATPLSVLLRRLAPLQKTGLLACVSSDVGTREVVLRTSDRRVQHVAAQTARLACEAATWDLRADALAAAADVVDGVARADAASPA